MPFQINDDTNDYFHMKLLQTCIQKIKCDNYVTDTKTITNYFRASTETFKYRNDIKEDVVYKIHFLLNKLTLKGIDSSQVTV